MVNLLFISDSPKAERIKNELQPLLKVMIDVVTDFDRGMKDVFEKRPAIICIQDHISGVSGESVARHIQMLLGSAAPAFILFHSASAKARVVNGLFEHLVDLNLPHDVMIENLLAVLKLLRGDHWDKVTIPSRSSRASADLSIAVPEESRDEPGKMTDDFVTSPEVATIPDVEVPVSLTEKQVIAAGKKSPAAPSDAAQSLQNNSRLDMPVKVQSRNDEMVEMLLAEVKKAEQEENSAKLSSGGTAASEIIPDISPQPVKIAGERIPAVIAGSPERTGAPSSTPPVGKPADSIPGNKDQKRNSAAATSPPTLPAEEFRISQNTPPVEEYIPEDLLLAFEENYRSKSLFIRRSYIVTLVCIACVFGAWYVFTQKPQIVNSLKQRILPSAGTKQTAVQVTTAISPQIPAPLPVPLPAAAPVLPSFIPQDGLDSTYAQNKPGWNRYVGTHFEFRVFTAEARIRAIQVLSVSAPIPESLIKSVLQEFAGSPAYQILSRTTKDGIRVENGKVQDTGEIILYRKNDLVKAFVVSVN